MRRARTGVTRAFARATASVRMLPTYLIIGTQKGGTTSLLAYLAEHPCVGEPERKEPHYFTLNAQRPLAWYRSFFPPQREARAVEESTGFPLQVGEATPYYLFHP